MLPTQVLVTLLGLSGDVGWWGVGQGAAGKRRLESDAMARISRSEAGKRTNTASRPPEDACRVPCKSRRACRR